MSPPAPATDRNPVPSQVVTARPSPVFLALLAATGAAGALCWTESLGGNTKYALLAFVLLGWIVSLCLHEFAHAATAYWGGDQSVEARGYLTLNPAKYLHAGLSLLMPVIFLLMGGIGLPGGAVWIHPGAIRTKWQRSVVSLAGPGANLVVGTLLALTIRAAKPAMENHPYVGAALSFLALLQFVAAFLNLLPIPGLDGFGAIEPYLSRNALAAIAPYRGYSLIVVFLLASQSRTFGDVVFGNAQRAIDALGVPRYGDAGDTVSLAEYGRVVFRTAIPWSGRIF